MYDYGINKGVSRKNSFKSFQEINKYVVSGKAL